MIESGRYANLRLKDKENLAGECLNTLAIQPWGNYGKNMKLKTKLEKVIKEYIKLFETKQGCEFEFAVGDDYLCELFFGDYSFNIREIIHDLESKAPVGLIYQWRDDCLDAYYDEKIDYTINYYSYTKGLRYGQNLKRNEPSKPIEKA